MKIAAQLNSHIQWVPLLVAALLVFEIPLHAQQTLGAITGEVTDSQGNILQSAAVTIVDEQTALTRTTTTNSSGS